MVAWKDIVVLSPVMFACTKISMVCIAKNLNASIECECNSILQQFNLSYGKRLAPLVLAIIIASQSGWFDCKVNKLAD